MSAAELYQRLLPVWGCLGLWYTTESLTVEVAGETYTIPAGFVFDGASIPRWLWPFIGHPMDHYWPAALVHDWLYETQPVSREAADYAFYLLLLRLGIDEETAVTMHEGVRLGGQDAWDGGPDRLRERQRESVLEGR